MKIKDNDIYYLKQYSNYPEEQTLNMFQKKIEYYDNKQQKYYLAFLKQLQKHMIEIIDRFNQEIFERIYEEDYKIEELVKILELVKYLSSENYEQLEDKYFNEYKKNSLTILALKKNIVNLNLLKQQSEIDIKKHGFKSKWINLVGKILNQTNLKSFVEINSSKDGFEEVYENRNELLKRIFFLHYDDVIKEFFSKLEKIKNTKVIL